MKSTVFSIFYFLLLCCTNKSYCQEKIISGEIRNKEHNKTLEYVNIGISNKGIGTVSNVKGLFKLVLNGTEKPNDTVLFSHIGFETIKKTVKELHAVNNIILLENETNTLKEVTVKFVKPKSKIFGRNSKGLGLLHFNFYSYYEKNVDDRLSKEIGIKFKLKKDCQINDLNFNITSNDFKSLKFRLNFYKIENGLPTEIVVDKNIIFEIKEGFLGWYKLDLKPYEIYLDKEIEDFAVTIQWVESVKMNSGNKYFGISTAISATETSFYREKAMDTWSKSGQSLSFYLNAKCR